MKIDADMPDDKMAKELTQEASDWADNVEPLWDAWKEAEAVLATILDHINGYGTWPIIADQEHLERSDQEWAEGAEALIPEVRTAFKRESAAKIKYEEAQACHRVRWDHLAELEE